MRYEKVVIRIEAESPGLVDAVTPVLEGKVVRGATLLYPKQFAHDPEVPTERWAEEIRSLLLEQQYVLHVELAEEGGGMTRTGCAYVVCNEQGDAIRPFHVPVGAPLKKQAFFSGASLVQVRATHQKDVEIRRVTPVDHIADGYVAIRYETIWRGYAHELPHLHDHYRNAVAVAVRKARCYHCRHVHYAAR